MDPPADQLTVNVGPPLVAGALAEQVGASGL